MLDPLSFSIPLDSSTPQPAGSPRPRRFLLVPDPENPDDFLCEIHYSDLASFMSCPRQFFNAFVLGRVGNHGSAATDAGTCFHLCEAERLTGSRPLKPIQDSIIGEFFRKHPVPPDEYRNSDCLHRAVEKYNGLYASDGWPDRVFHHEGLPMVERTFKVGLCTIPINALIDTRAWGFDEPEIKTQAFVRNIHFIYGGTIDAVLAIDSFLWIVDHKTTSRGGKEWEESFRLSLQTRGYAWAFRELTGRTPTGAILNGIVWRRPTATGNPFSFVRNNYFYPDWSLNEFHQNAVDLCQDIVSALLRDSFPQTARSFASPCAHCAYTENCVLPPEQRLADLRSPLYSPLTQRESYE